HTHTALALPLGRDIKQAREDLKKKGCRKQMGHISVRWSGCLFARANVTRSSMPTLCSCSSDL
ncbi:hypothetical protein CF336_g9463, partial [Tilletia laevis]